MSVWELDISGLIVEAKKLGLVEEGMPCKLRKDSPAYDVLCPGNLRELWEVRQLLPRLYDKDAFARRGRNSYGLKHELEDFSSYISNASTILMASYLGYILTPYQEDSMNINIRAKRFEEDQLVKNMAEYCRVMRRHKNPYGVQVNG